MADELRIGATGVDYAKWKKLTPQEIIKEEGKGEEIPAEILTWAQQMAAFSKIPDNVTYEQVDGDIGLEALEKLGIEDETRLNPEANNAQKPTETEEPDAIKDTAATGEIEEEDAQFTVPEEETPISAENPDIEGEQPEDELSLADTALTTDPEEIRKRKERKGLA